MGIFKTRNGMTKTESNKTSKSYYGIHRNDADDTEWITVNGTHIPIKDGELQGSVGSKISGNKSGSTSIPKGVKDFKGMKPAEIEQSIKDMPVGSVIKTSRDTYIKKGDDNWDDGKPKPSFLQNVRTGDRGVANQIKGDMDSGLFDMIKDKVAEPKIDASKKNRDLTDKLHALGMSGKRSSADDVRNAIDGMEEGTVISYQKGKYTKVGDTTYSYEGKLKGRDVSNLLMSSSEVSDMLINNAWEDDMDDNFPKVIK